MSQTIDLKTGAVSWLPRVPDDYPWEEDRPFTRRLREIQRGICHLPGERTKWQTYGDMSNVIGGRPSASWMRTLDYAKDPWSNHRPPSPGTAQILAPMMRATSMEVVRWIVREWYDRDVPKSEEIEDLYQDLHQMPPEDVALIATIARRIRPTQGETSG